MIDEFKHKNVHDEEVELLSDLDQIETLLAVAISDKQKDDYLSDIQLINGRLKQIREIDD